MPNVAAQKGSRLRKDQQVRPADQLRAIEMLLNGGFDRSAAAGYSPHSVFDRPLQHLSDETLGLLVESARQLEEGSGVVFDAEGQIVTK